MRIIVGDRGEGKTSALVEWLLAGHSIPAYPGWSRAIVCAHRKDILRLVQVVSELTHDWPDELATYDVRKVIWGINDLIQVSRGSDWGNVEYAIDDVHIVLQQAMGISKPPELVALTATGVTQLGVSLVEQMASLSAGGAVLHVGDDFFLDQGTSDVETIRTKEL
jgi:hypothetical protein